MKTLSANYAAHIARPVTTLSVCWRIVKRNGDIIMGTDHDRDIVIETTNIGMDTGSPVSNTYKPPFAFTGTIHEVRVELK